MNGEKGKFWFMRDIGREDGFWGWGLWIKDEWWEIRNGDLVEFLRWWINRNDFVGYSFLLVGKKECWLWKLLCMVWDEKMV